MNHWQLAPSERLKEWRKFRKHLETLDDEDCVAQIIDWWSTAPLSTRVIDPFDNTHWPDPWQLLYNGEYDENIISLGIAYTLELLDWECEVLLVQNTEKGFLNLVILVDDDYVLNYTYNKVEPSSVLSDVEILKKWDSSELT